ncbi:MAG: type I methionyl aminopeptidase [Deltaproteobacteria bacterium]|nr:type I methionyl aminopeptidase [Deltaproteobacteria bacterium]
MTSVNGKTGRNDFCPCGSGRKYKTCCLPAKDRAFYLMKQQYLRQYRIRLKDPKDVEGIRSAGSLAVASLDYIAHHLAPEITTEYINSLIHDFITSQGATPAPLNYMGFPKSACTSVNEVVCHGIPGKRVLREGDIINVDVTPILNGYYADANKTFFIGSPGVDAEKIVSAARECLKRGIAMVKPGNTVGDIGWAIQEYAESLKCSVVREYTGHGVGYAFHEPPEIPHIGQRDTGIVLVPGMVFTIEPMINLGGPDLRLLDDNWTVLTVDRSLSAQFEQTVVVTDDGVETLTPYNLEEPLLSLIGGPAAP